ncbi:hypothetical protein [Bacillus multifaciens]|uniref:hypothetical protein n=1 Tax=Bacillus multifaciens TaxID=3068506 RepID=UPI002742871E|nr:hypothetical protein [Bacillus sp. WLY-B-L8]MDP7981532.1 hypothetical protein [Bacillus sp. WLY-B-L8]
MKNKILSGLFSFVLLFSFIFPTFTDASVTSENENTNENIVENYVEEDYGIDLSKVDVSNFNFEEFEKDYDFLVNDPVFVKLEEEISKPRVEHIIEKNPFTGELIVKEEVLPAIVIGALRVLTSKVGRNAADKAWKIARPYVQKALDAPSKYIIDGPSGGKIIQVRSKATKQPIFRLDYHYIDGKGPYLHYHVAPNMNKHYYL